MGERMNRPDPRALADQALPAVSYVASQQLREEHPRLLAVADLAPRAARAARIVTVALAALVVAALVAVLIDGAAWCWPLAGLLTAAYLTHLAGLALSRAGARATARVRRIVADDFSAHLAAVDREGVTVTVFPAQEEAAA